MAEDLRARFCQAAARVPDLPHLPVISEELLENDRIVQFLQWFCDDVYSTNILTADELGRYQVIRSSGKIYQGDQLEDAVERMENFGCVSTEDLSTEQLKQEISDLQLDVIQARDHLDTLVQVKTQLDRHHADLLHEKDSIQASEKSYQQLHQGKLYACKKGNVKLNESLEQLKCTVGDTMELCKQADGELDCYGDDKPVEQSPFLSAYSLDSYHSLEEKFTQALVAYTKKQFFQGIANLSDDDNDNDNVEKLLTMDGELKEMQRLQAVHPISEVKRINTVTQEQQLLTTSACAEKQIMLLSQANYNTSDDENNLKAQTSKLQEQLSVVTAEMKEVGQHKIPGLVQEMAKLKFIGVFSTDHDLKLARQDYFTSKQDKVIDYLRDQLSRHELFLMMYEVELRRHRELHMLLKAIQSQLTTWKDEHDRKIKLLQEMPQISTAQTHQAISPMDKISSGVYKLLENSGMMKTTLVPTFPDLLSSCKQLVNQVENLTGACRVLRIDQLQQTAQLQQMVLQYEELLKRCNVLVDSDQPITISKELSDTFNQLTGLINKLENELKQLMEEFNSRKRILATNPWLQKERELFVHFFTDPAKLQQMFSDLVTTVDSHSLLQSKATV